MSEISYTFHLHGMHCAACKTLTESELTEHPKVSSARSNLTTRSVEISGDFGDMTPVEIVTELTTLLSEHRLSTEPEKKAVNWQEFAIAIPITIGFAFLFILLQKLGIVNVINAGTVTYGTAFVIGIVASLSTCMAVVGGLVLSMSATFAREGDTIRPQVLFHLGRIISFFILGGVIGAVGSVFALGATGTFVLGILVALVMLVLGLNLLDIFHWTKRFQPAMPRFLAQRALNIKKINHTLTPALVGIATFFLPCGFTQSMQLYTLTTGSFIAGGLTMLSFAFGTLPALAVLSFSSVNIQHNPKSGIFFKTAGLIVILFGLFNLINSLVAFGALPPVFNF